MQALLFLAFILQNSPSAQAWDAHSVPALTYWTAHLTAGSPGDSVTYQPLEVFLEKNSEGLNAVVAEVDRTASERWPHYPKWSAKIVGTGKSFREAMRISPKAKLGAFIHDFSKPVGTVNSSNCGAPVQEFTLAPKSFESGHPLRILKAGEKIPATWVLASASDEPDYGLDFGLWADNDTDEGKRYGFGPQPFGNPKLEFGTQAPFHMTFLSEPGWIYKAAPFLKQTYLGYRILLYRAIGHYALANATTENGGAYWGYRFLGWATHYAQDLTQPYHSTVLPGVSPFKMLGINALAMAGYDRLKNEAIQRVSNRHLLLERLEYQLLTSQNPSATTWKEVLNTSLAGKRPPPEKTSEKIPPDLAEVLPEPKWVEWFAARSNAVAPATDLLLSYCFPKKWVDDPLYIFGETEHHPDVLKLFLESPGNCQKDLVDLLAERFRDFGAFSGLIVGK